MIRRRGIGCSIALAGLLSLCVTLPIGVLGLAWFIYDLARWGRVPYWLLSIYSTGVALCLPGLGIVIIIVGLLISLFSSNPRRG